MFCKECGKELAKGAKFCMFCGSLIENLNNINDSKEINNKNNKKDKNNHIIEIDSKMETKKDKMEKENFIKKINSNTINSDNLKKNLRKNKNINLNNKNNNVENIKEFKNESVIENNDKEKPIPIPDPIDSGGIKIEIEEKHNINPVEEIKAKEINRIDDNKNNNDIFIDSSYNSNKLNEIMENITDIEYIAKNLYPLALDTSIGFRSLFIGDSGTKKDEIINKVFNYLKSKDKIKDIKKISFSNIPNSFDLETLYIIQDFETAISYLFNLESFSEEASQSQLKYQKLLENLINADGTAYIICDIKEHLLRSFNNLDLRLGYLFESRIFFKDLNYNDIYNDFKSNVSFKFDFNEDFREYFFSYLDKNRRYFPFKNKDLAIFLADYVNRGGKMFLPQDKIDNKSMDEFFNGIYGLEDIKERIRDLDIFLQSKNRLVLEGIKFPPMNLHMMFLGNPGCGKTTLARYIGKILFERGFLRENKFIEATSKDLVAGALTGIKTSKLIQSAMGGVLFIDEAYSLVDCGQAGAEAIAILIKAMEDHKDDLVVMFAGYTREMGEFVDTNSGIVSRIQYTFKFENYNKEELYEIFKLKLKNTGMKIKEEDEDEIKIRMIDDLMSYSLSITNSGNGRFVDRVLQATLINHAKNQKDKPLDKIITLEDIPLVENIALK